MLNELSALEHSHLGEAIAHLHAHEVPTNGSAITFATATALDNVGIEYCSVAHAI
jgi:UDP-3-O-acyl-N-acetylglucosamine deacetylase